MFLLHDYMLLWKIHWFEQIVINCFSSKTTFIFKVFKFGFILDYNIHIFMVQSIQSLLNIMFHMKIYNIMVK